MEVDIEAIAQELIEVSAKRALDNMPADKRAAFDGAIHAKVEDYVANLTQTQLDVLIGGQIAAAAVGHMRYLVNQQVATGEGSIVELIRTIFKDIFRPEQVAAFVVKTLENKAHTLFMAVARESVDKAVARLSGEVVATILKKGVR